MGDETMTSELPAGWEWVLVDTSPEWHRLAHDHRFVGCTFRMGDHFVTSVQTEYYADQATADACLLASALALQGELPPNVRDVLEQCRMVVPFAGLQSFVRPSDLVARINALLGKETT